MFLFLIYVVFGLYFINSSLNFVTLPTTFASFDKWIFLVGGIFLVVGGASLIKLGKKKEEYGR